MTISISVNDKAHLCPDGTTDYKPLRSRARDINKTHIQDVPLTWGNWYKKVDWLNTTFVIFIPAIGLISSYWIPLHPYTAIFSAIYYFNTGLGITAGYHRLWSHHSFKATLPLQIYLAAMGAGAVEGSIRWWVKAHRAHHRYTDTDQDPYSVNKGFLYSHLGWMVMKQNPKRLGRTDISDLNEDPVVIWQHCHFLSSVLVMAIVFPMFVCGLGWGDWSGGFVYAGILRIFTVQQATFCVNSLAHWLGDQPFDDRRSPRDHFITALITLGEGYHNFHHEFPSDYRNTIEWWQYDPTKWAIIVWEFLGLAYDLKQLRSNEIEMGRIQQLQKKLDRKRADVDWGTPLGQLPVISWDDFTRRSKEGEALVVIAGIVHNVADFIEDHPGGKALIRSGIGKDVTAIFNGGIYNHSNAAHNFLCAMRVGLLRGGCEVEVWKDHIKDLAGESIIRAGGQVTKIVRPIQSAETT
ncbi:Acyl-CoA desaturase [Fusarium floridanum]|uniref:Acyl-CoA desaturase n=1 Tax=Fusarium floridanum TaxID=1325733 RepID=A0A428RP27_9HYPO|nr:Acyl-CoA desaturase [Fusarium floridanum]